MPHKTIKAFIDIISYVIYVAVLLLLLVPIVVVLNMGGGFVVAIRSVPVNSISTLEIDNLKRTY